MKKLILTAAAAMLAFTLTAVPGVAQDSSATGEVRKIDQSAGKITLKHGPIKSLGMDEGMTMVFRVKDPAMLDQLKVGEKINFTTEKAGGAFTVTSFEPAK